MGLAAVHTRHKKYAKITRPPPYVAAESWGVVLNRNSCPTSRRKKTSTRYVSAVKSRTNRQIGQACSWFKNQKKLQIQPKTAV